ncbi:GntR family transcriptional regulator [Mycobacterium sp. NAZ190054]|uniref:GntR family transcriptional regulator n=1 Tax=Mycobacterium sp. NAZ190054 TaxID=1747766 RepID=UPI000792F625|nr:GntR family transcriptional regulator [Mycobacterium sp. NAZ190054]KWX60571.1 hypothetical protein ASJ79_29930 [Mycobacterium sp. NAZ190054]
MAALNEFASDRRSGAKGVTVVQRLVDALRQRILSGDLEPGSRIVIDELRLAYGVSHIPLREALRILQGEGLLTHVPNHGTHVAQLSASEIDGLYELRLMLEPPLIEKACRMKRKADSVAVSIALKEMVDLSPGEDSIRFQDAHRAFHAALVLPGASQVARGVLEPIWQRVQRYHVKMYRIPMVPPLGGVQHEQIAMAWNAGDPGCGALLREHLEDGRRQMSVAISELAEST